MSKKILAMLMALAMIISMVPMTAMAASCEHEWISGYQPYGDGCAIVCSLCSEAQAGSEQPHSFVGDKCHWCKAPAAAPEKPEEPACDHKGGAWTSNGDGTHTSKCECGEFVDGPHPCQYLGTGKCFMCGYESHKCTMDELVSISKTQHRFKCGCGEYVGVPMNHYDADGDRKCDGCSYVMYELPECDHEGGAWTSNGDGTHTSKCECGEFVDGPHPCQDLGTGKCYMCGYEFHKCTFEAGVTSNDDGTHKVNCKCGNFVTVNCLDNDGDGKCDSCGYQKYIAPEGEHEHNYIAHSNNDGTHLLVCNCGKSVKFTCLDSDGDGKCDSCGYQKYPTCDHKPGPWKSNDNGTHTSSCGCGKNTTTEACQFIGSKCQKCGYEKHVDSDAPDTPIINAKPVVNYSDYDDVPKTGDVLSMILAFFGI